VATLFTIGHGTASAEDFLQRLAGAGLRAIVDVRSRPGSRRHPQFSRVAMERWLPEHGVAYSWEPRLGGFRTSLPDSPNLALRHSGFRGYADHTRSDEFSAALAAVLGLAASQPSAVMCAETVWWRCHRRILADAAVLLHGATVVHVVGRALQPHRLTDHAHADAGRLLYAEPSLFA
jgi:uncharacterized protein (DUF488 family)